MKLEDLNKLKIYTQKWCALSTDEQMGYMVGFLDCQKQIMEILEKEEISEKTCRFNIKLLEEQIRKNEKILNEHKYTKGIDGFKVFIETRLEIYKIELEKHNKEIK